MADELAKLKLLQSRRAIEVFEYNDQKQKLLKIGPPSFSVADELAKLKSLFDSGVINLFDYNNQKKNFFKIRRGCHF